MENGFGLFTLLDYFHILSLYSVLVSILSARNIGVNKREMILWGVSIELMILCGIESINEVTYLYIMNSPC